MARLIVDLNPFLGFYDDKGSPREFLRQGLALEMAGADGLIFDTGEAFDPVRRKILDILKSNLNLELTVRSCVDGQWVEYLEELEPSLTIFKFSEENVDKLSEFITRLQIKDVLIGLEVPLEMDFIKKAAKLKTDYLFLDCNSYCEAKSLNQEIEELNKIVKMASLASKLSLGVIAAAEFDNRKLKRLNDTGAIEEFVVGRMILGQSLLNGYRSAFQDIRFSIS